jgi:prepilin-type N-terminal cleavage/methylation domain-containing protein
MNIKAAMAKAGFTLVEIMIVVAIIGLLATMAVPSFRKAQEKSYRVTCINNLQQIDGAMQQWALDMRKDEAAPVTYNDIASYLKNEVSCPSGGTSFEDSYTITTVDAPPLCQRKPETHKLSGRAGR